MLREREGAVILLMTLLWLSLVAVPVFGYGLNLDTTIIVFIWFIFFAVTIIATIVILESKSSEQKEMWNNRPLSRTPTEET